MKDIIDRSIYDLLHPKWDDFIKVDGPAWQYPRKELAKYAKEEGGDWYEITINTPIENIENAPIILFQSGMVYDKILKKLGHNPWRESFERKYQKEETETPYKYHEGEILNEVGEYIKGTYHGHYIGENNIQSLDLIFASGAGEGFCRGNVLKLGARYGKKEGKNRKDLLKIIHYAMLLMYLQDKENNKNND